MTAPRGAGGVLQYLVGSGPLWASVADLDHDGHLDFVIAEPGYTTHNVFVVLAAGTAVSCDPGTFDAGGHCQACSAVSECIGVLTCTGAADSRCSQCATGYEQLADGAACSDIDECDSENGGCDAHATCTNVDGGRTCECKPRFSGDGLTCDPVMCNDPANGATILAGYVDGGAFTVGAVPRATAVGDIDGDGIPDVVSDSNASTGPGAISVRLGDGAGGFCGGADFDAGKGGYGLVLVDVNQDGKLDVAVSSFDSADVRVLLNTTSATAALPTFAPAVAFATGAGSSALAVGDFNGDGKKDLVTANFSGSVTVLLNTTAIGAGTPSFTSSALTAGARPNGAFVADFDRDGRDDIAIANYNNLQIGSASVFLNKTPTNAATPTFDAPLSLGAGAGPDGISGGDFDGDGAPDLVVANQGEATVSVFLNRLATAGHNFASQVKYTVTTTGTQTAAVTVADVDGDTHLDIVATAGLETTISYGVGDGTFEAPAASLQYLAGSGPLWASVADLDHDGHLDFVIAEPGYTTHNVFVVLAAGTAVSCDPGTFDAGGHCQSCSAVSECIGVLTCTGADRAAASARPATSSWPTALPAATSTRTARTAAATRTRRAQRRRRPHLRMPRFSGDGLTCDPVMCNDPRTAPPSSRATSTAARSPSAPSARDAVGDIDGDGIPDVVSDSNASTGPGAISVRLGDGAAASAAAPTSTPARAATAWCWSTSTRTASSMSRSRASRAPTCVQHDPGVGGRALRRRRLRHRAARLAVGDFNGDGKKTRHRQLRRVRHRPLQHHGLGAGTRVHELGATAGARPNGAFVADFDRDGRDDIAIANYNNLQSARPACSTRPDNAATPTFDAPLTLGAGAGPDGISGGDFDGTAPRLVVANQGEATVSVFLNRLALATTSRPRSYTVDHGHQTAAVTVADVDGDTHLDIVATTASRPPSVRRRRRHLRDAGGLPPVPGRQRSALVLGRRPRPRRPPRLRHRRARLHHPQRVRRPPRLMASARGPSRQPRNPPWLGAARPERPRLTALGGPGLTSAKTIGSAPAESRRCDQAPASGADPTRRSA
ncbi:MAG: FG-GAP-like repeat-containing protein [Myxococcota bacterium]